MQIRVGSESEFDATSSSSITKFVFPVVLTVGDDADDEEEGESEEAEGE